MIDEPSASDLQKAYQILSEFGLLIGPAGKNSDAIARAIAAGIALGRKEASPDKPKKKRWAVHATPGIYIARTKMQLSPAIY
jgi:hypothetical protein